MVANFNDGATIIMNTHSFALQSVLVCKINIMVILGKGKGPEKNLIYMITLWPKALGELISKAEVPVLLAFREIDSSKRLRRVTGQEVDS